MACDKYFCRDVMTLHQLKIFETVSKHLNVTKASKELRISQPSVSKQIKSLQEYWGVKLFKRIGRRIDLTTEGRLFRTEAQEILLRLEKLRRRYGKHSLDSANSSLIIGGSHAASVSFLPPMLAAFKKSHALVDVTLRTETSRGVERLVLDSEIELGVVMNLSNPTDLRRERFRQEKLVPFVCTRHPLAKKKNLTLGEFAQTPLIVKKKRGAKTSQVLKQIQDHGFKADVLMECESAEAVKLAVLKGLGVGILYQDHISSEIRNDELKILTVKDLKEIEARSFLISRKDAPLSSYAQDFRKLLLKHCNESSSSP
jgi:DNA-binding transcriptional LysR family regulator